MTDVKVMEVWNGNNFVFHSSQELKLVKKELMANAIVVESEAHGVIRYLNKTQPYFWCRAIPATAIDQGMVQLQNAATLSTSGGNQ
ncbi:MAG: hypothetical protein WCS27_00385 [Victivallaceae bacterium]|jgi:hypothetical protein